MQFSPSDAPYAFVYFHPPGAPPLADGTVVECRCPCPCPAAGGGSTLVGWEVVRARPDRAAAVAAGGYFGNDLRVAEATWLNYVDPFPAPVLWEGRRGAAPEYFAAERSAAYRAQTAALSFAKTRAILAALQGAAWVVDLGAGRGQDLGRYAEAGVRNLLAVDRDRAALAELVRRKLDLAGRGGGAGERGKRRGAPAPGPAVRVVAADLTGPAPALAALLAAAGPPLGEADGVVCNLAVHYFLAGRGGAANFAALAAALLRPGGRLLVTALDGAAVHALLAPLPPGGAWEAREDGVLKYAVRRLYASPALEAEGQTIAVLLPFSAGEFYEEPLVNFAALGDALAAAGFAPAGKAPAADALPVFRARNPGLADALTPADRQWLGLFAEASWVKKG